MAKNESNDKDQSHTAAGLQVVVTGTDLTIVITDNTSFFGEVVQLVREHLDQVVEFDPNTILEVVTAVEEALANAVIHGNLEVSSETRRDSDIFLRLVEQRRNEAPFRERRVTLQVRIASTSIEFLVGDEGPGFDPDEVRDPHEFDAPSPSGNGLLLIRTFMDEVQHSEKGNEITMIRRLSR